MARQPMIDSLRAARAAKRKDSQSKTIQDALSEAMTPTYAPSKSPRPKARPTYAPSVSLRPKAKPMDKK